MKVINRINNNVVLVRNRGKKMIVTGKGVGFKVYPGDTVNEQFVEQKFILKEDGDTDYYVKMLQEISAETLGLSKKIVEIAEEELNKELSGNLIFALADHISFAIERIQEGVEAEHPLAWEIRQFYPREMKAGIRAVELLREETGINIPDGEAVFITMHFVNAVGGLSEQYDASELTEMMVHIVAMIEAYCGCSIDQTSAVFSRFITHLRYYLIRHLNFEIDNSMNEDLLELVREKCPKASKCAEMVTEYFDRECHTQSTPSERLYLTLHINRLITKKGDER